MKSKLDDIAGFIVIAGIIGLIVFAVNACITRIVVTGG